MNRTSFALIGLTAALLLAASPAARAQDVQPTVSASGMSTVKKQPTTLRMQIQTQVSGKDLKEALAKLKEREDAIRKQLVGLGAADKSIEFGAPSVGAPKSDRQRQMEIMVKQRLAMQGKKDAKDETVKPVTVAAGIKAEWPLKSDSPEGMLLHVNDIQEKVKAANFGGTAAATQGAKEMTEEEEEEEMVHSSYGEEEPKPGEPVFVYVGTITPEERAKALSDAFAKAKADASRLAAAAGSKLGGVRQLNGMARPGYNGMNRGYDGAAYLMMQQMMGGDDGESTGDEAVGPQPDAVSYHVSVTASFVLQ